MKIIIHPGTSACFTADICTDQPILYGHSGDCTLLLDGDGTYTACQMTLALPEGCSLLDAGLAFNHGDGHQLETNHLGNGRYNVVVCSPLRQMFGSGPLLHLNITGNYASGINVSDVMMVDTRMEPVVLESVDGAATNIDNIYANEASPGIYNIQGMKMKTLPRGQHSQRPKGHGEISIYLLLLCRCHFLAVQEEHEGCPKYANSFSKTLHIITSINH